MAQVSRGFFGRRRPSADRDARLPPGQYDVGQGFPVLSAGATPRANLDRWDFRIQGRVEQGRRWSWPEFQALPREDVTVDIHCVTSWSKFDTVGPGCRWTPCSSTCSPPGRTSPRSATGGYTTNLPLADLTGGKAWVVDHYDGDRSGLTTADRLGCWYPTCTSGSPRSGYAG
jgi:hypothetical protein